MYLSDKDIEQVVKEGEITIHNFDKKRLNPASYDILLGNKFVITEDHVTTMIDPKKKILPKTKEIILKDSESYILHPGVSILGTSYDYFGSDNFLIFLNGKSSLARIGLMVHNTAGLVNPGHFLNITLELCNLNKVPIILRPKMAIGQLTFSPLSSKTDRTYKVTGRFNGDNWKNNFALEKKTKKSNRNKK